MYPGLFGLYPVHDIVVALGKKPLVCPYLIRPLHRCHNAGFKSAVGPG